MLILREEEGIMEKIYFSNNRNQNLAGILEDKGKDKIVLIVHGYGSGKDGNTATMLAESLAERNVSSFRIDLSGSGESEGDLGTSIITNWVSDVEAAISLLRERGFKKIDLFGSSAGGLVVMVAALEHPEIGKLGLKAPVSDYFSQRLRKFGKKLMEKWKKDGWIEYYGVRMWYKFIEDARKWTIYDKADKIKCPVLIVHGDKDDSVLLEDSQELVKHLPDGGLIILNGADHALAIDGDRSKGNKLFADWFS